MNNESFLWKRGHFELSDYDYSNRAEKVLIYMKGFWGSPLILLFKEDDNLRLIENDSKNVKWSISSWLDNTGIIYKETEELENENCMVNLNKPSVISKLIEYHRKSTWNPKETKEKTIVEDALMLLDEIENLKTKANKT